MKNGKKSNHDFYVVGIGASAGGLEAVLSLFDTIPNDTGMAFVILQQLIPDDKSKIKELLSKHTTMPVQLAKNNDKLTPNNIYLNPKEKNIVLQKDRIIYIDNSTSPAPNHAFDIFFHSLMKSFGEKSIGIFLSGTDKDNSINTRTIKRDGGNVIIQKTESEQNNGILSNGTNSMYAELIANKYGPASVLINSSFEILFINGDINDYLQYRPVDIKSILLDILISDKLKVVVRDGVRSTQEKGKKVVFKNIPISNKGNNKTVTLTFQQFEIKASGETTVLVTFEKEEVVKEDTIVYDEYKNDEFSKQRTEYLEAELELLKNQNYINSIYNSALTGIYVYNFRKRKIEFVNPRYEEILGYSFEEVNRMSNEEFFALCHAGDQKDIEAHMQQVSQLKRGEIKTIEYRFKSKNKGWIWCLSYDTGYEYDEKDNLVSFIGSFLNITDYKISQEKLEEALKNIESKNKKINTSNAKLKEINLALEEAKQKIEKSEFNLLRAQKISRLGSWYLDVKTNEVEWTEELYNMYGFDPKRPPPPYTEHMKLFTPESWELLSTSLTKTSETGIPYELELNTVKKDGSNGWMWVRGEALKDGNGEIYALWGAAQDITEHKEILKALTDAKEKSEENARQYQKLFENMQQGFALHKMIFDENKRPIDYEFVIINRAFERQTGIVAKDFIGKKVSELLPNLEKDWIEKYGKVALTGESIKFQNYSADLDKHFNVTAYCPEKGFFATIFDDVTEQKRILEDIENAKKLNDTLIESSPFGILVYNSDGNCIKTNEMASKITGGAKSQLLQKNYHTLESWKTANLYSDAVQTMSTGNKTSGIEEINTSFGKVFWIEYFFVRFIYDNKPHLLFKFNNVNDRIKDQKQLKESEIRYKNMFYDNKSVMLLMDPENGRIVDANKAAVNYYGYSIEQLKNMKISEINMLSEKEVKEEIENAKTDKKSFFQFRHKLSNGKIRNVKVYTGKILVNEKVVLYSIVHDNTNEIQALEKLKKQTIELVQSKKMSALGTLIAGVAHELNNPLMGILNYADYSLKHVPENNKAFPVLKDLKEEAEKSADIVKGLLTFSRKEDANSNQNYKTDLIVALEAVMKILRLKMKNKNINLYLPKTNEKLICNINLGYLQQVLFNVLDNAIYAVENTNKKEIKIEVNKQVKNNVIKISDSGMGISTEQGNNIFDPFFTTKPVGNGTGLGLSICKNILNDIGGDISFRSKPGNGTVFTIKIPSSNDN